MMDIATILIIEAHNGDQIFVKSALQKNSIGAQAHIVNDGAEALDFLFCRNIYTDRYPQAMPRLVLLDLNLPRTAVLDTLHSLRSDPRTHFLPVVLLATSSEGEMVLDAYKAGATYHLLKPTDYFEFLQFTWQFGQCWLRWSESFL